MKKKLCLIAEDYPSEGKPSFTFVQELAYGMTKLGYECFVVAPQSLSKAIIRREKLLKKVTTDSNRKNGKINVYRPYIITFSNTKVKFLNNLAYYLYGTAIKRVVARIRPDYAYCYFWHMGLITAKALHNKRIKLFVQASECDIDINSTYIKEKLINRIDGVVCASRKNYDESISYDLITPNSYSTIIPNGFRRDVFYPMDKRKAREMLGIDQDKFIVAFVGGFIERKGINRLSEAIDRFDDVYTIFIGKGELPPTCKNILFQGTVPHDQLTPYLNSADLFVLPTRAEGCCNAILEAVACGLPVISSNKTFNDEILDDSYAIRINEDNVDEIEEAIRKIKDDYVLRREMSNSAIESSRKFYIESRASAICSFLENIRK